MRCNKVECFAYNIKWDNNCEALFDITGCTFFKTRGQIIEETLDLIAKGKPQYEPAVTRQDQRRLKALLQKNERTDDMDKT